MREASIRCYQRQGRPVSPSDAGRLRTGHDATRVASRTSMVEVMDPSHGLLGSVYCHPPRLAVSCSGLIRCPLVLIASGVAPYANTVPDASTPSLS